MPMQPMLELIGVKNNCIILGLHISKPYIGAVIILNPSLIYMALTDFFRINLPYGIQKNKEGYWSAFNREYKPLGYNESSSVVDFDQLPVHTKYKGLTSLQITKLIKNREHIHLDESGDVWRFFLYEDKTNPQSSPAYWDEYFTKIKSLSKFEVDEISEDRRVIKPVIWNNVIDALPKDDRLLQVLSSQQDGEWRASATYNSIDDGEYKPGFYTLDKNGNEVLVNFKVCWWAYDDYLPY